MATKKKTEDQVEEQPKPKTKRKPKAVSANENPVEEAPKVQDIPAPGEQRDVDISEIPQEIRDNIIGSMAGSPTIASTLANMFAQTPPSQDANMFTENKPPVVENPNAENSTEDNASPPISYKDSHGGSFRAFDYMNEDENNTAPSNTPDNVEVVTDSYHDYGLNSVDAQGNVQQNQTNDLLMGLLMNAAKKSEEGVDFNEGVKQILAGVLKTLEIHDYNTDTLFDKVNKINGLLSKELLISVGAIVLSSIAIISSLNSGRKTRRIKHEIRRRGI